MKLLYIEQPIHFLSTFAFKTSDLIHSTMPSKGKNRDNNLEKCSSGSSKVKASITNTSTSFSPKLDHQFEAELCWCIQQIQIALKSGKLNNKQGND